MREREREGEREREREREGGGGREGGGVEREVGYIRSTAVLEAIVLG